MFAGISHAGAGRVVSVGEYRYAWLSIVTTINKEAADDRPLTTLFTRMDGTTATLGDYLIANVASACGLTPEYEGLEKLYEECRDQGLVVIGFPASDFKLHLRQEVLCPLSLHP